MTYCSVLNIFFFKKSDPILKITNDGNRMFLVKFGKSLYELIVLNPPGYEEFLLIIFEKLEQIFSKTPAQPVLRSKVKV